MNPTESGKYAATTPHGSPPLWLTIRTEWSQRSFAPGQDIVVGRDRSSDVQLTDPLVSRIHLIARFESGRWKAVDSGSANGIFENGRRVAAVDIHPGGSVNLGGPEGPPLTFAFESPWGTRTPAAEATEVSGQDRPTQWLTPGADATVSNHLDHTVPTFVPPTSTGTAPTTVGRAPDNDLVVDDLLVSRRHATLTPAAGPVRGVEIHDAGTVNGTFVNGTRIKTALLRDGDTVTIGNTDFVCSAGTLVPRRAVEDATYRAGLDVSGVTLTIEKGRTLLNDVSFEARPGTLTAVIGPSGAGKSTLAKLIAGTNRPTSGHVSFQDRDLHEAYASLRTRIGLVPQEDVLHGGLTVDQALAFAAELRLPPDTTAEDRRKVMAAVLEELELTEHAHKRVDKLSGGQRKRASVAMELLTGPSLLILDEPTSGLDPALDRQVMTMLRKLAGAGRVVIVVTHSLTHLDECDQVLLLAPGGATAFCGPPADIGAAMGTTNWADIFQEVGADPDAASRRFLARGSRSQPQPTTKEPVPLDKIHTSFRRQFSAIARRQLRLVVSDRGYFLFLAALPFILGALSLAVPGNTGFGQPDPTSSAADEPSQILVLLSLGAIFMGVALTIRDLVGERDIYRRERAVGLSPSAYLLAKVAVYSAAAVIQSTILVAIVLVGKGTPTRGASLLHNGSLELYVAVVATCVTSVILGLALSAVARSNEQVMPLLVVSIMAQLVLSGGLLAVTARAGLEQLSWITPGRWGYNAAASTVDLRALEPDPLSAQDVHWYHTPGAWLFDMAMLAVLSMVYGCFVRWKLRLTSD